MWVFASSPFCKRCNISTELHGRSLSFLAATLSEENKTCRSQHNCFKSSFFQGVKTEVLDSAVSHVVRWQLAWPFLLHLKAPSLSLDSERNKGRDSLGPLLASLIFICLGKPFGLEWETFVAKTLNSELTIKTILLADKANRAGAFYHINGTGMRLSFISDPGVRSVCVCVF